MRVLTLCLGIGIMLTAACGGSSSKSGTNSNGRDSLTGQCSVSTSSQTCTGDAAAYAQCLEAACDTQLAAALGSGYASGSRSGPCAALITCELACPCGGATQATCENNCFATNVTNNASCAAAFAPVETCVGQATLLPVPCVAPVCTPKTTGTVTTTTINTSTLTTTTINTSTLTTNCAKAVSCCTTLMATAGGTAYQQTCAQVATFNDAECVQFLSDLQPYNLCN